MPRKRFDHALAVVKAGLNLVPGVGGAIASLVGDYVPLSTQRGIERTVDLLREQLTALQGRLDTDAVDKDEFSELFKSCYLVAVRTHHEEKLRVAAGLLANLLLKPGDPDKLTYTELDHFVRCLDALSIGAITVLGAALSIMRASPSNLEGQARFDFERLRTKLPRQMEPELVMGLVGELNACYLLHLEEPAIKTPQFGNYSLELTPLGRRFVTFVEGEVPT